MGLGVGFALLPRLLPGERILYCKPWIWAVSGKSLPSYRVSLMIPLVQEAGLYVTDRRILLPCFVFRLVVLEFVAWFESEDESRGEERVREVCTGRSCLLGPYLEIVTHTAVKHWFRSPDARIRVFMGDPEPVCSIISEAVSDRIKIGPLTA